MLPLGAFAVAVLLNGVQIWLPAPAFVEQGRTWAPARPIFQRLGHRVTWDAGSAVMTIRAGDREALFPIGSSPSVDGTALPAALAARRVDGTIYVPLMALRQLGLKVQWDELNRSVRLSGGVEATGRPSLAAVLADPPAWVGREVTIAGEYAGWTADRFHFATRQGPPVSSGDWVLHNEDGAIYCHAGPASAAVSRSPSLTPLTSPLPSFTPYAAAGRRITASGTICLSSQAIPYLQYSTVAPTPGRHGITCRLTPGRLQYQAGQTVTWTVVIGNLGQQTQSLTGGGCQVSLRTPNADIVVIKQSSGARTSVGGAIDDAVELQVSGSYALPPDGLMGQYALSLWIDDEIFSYPSFFEVTNAR